MSWKSILKKEVDTGTFVSYIVDDSYYGNGVPKEKFLDAVLEKINDESVMSKINESNLLHSKDMLRITRDNFSEIFDLSRYLKDLYNKVSREFTKEEIAETMEVSFSFLDDSPSNSTDKTEEIDEYIVDFIVEKAKPFVRKALQPRTSGMIFSGTLPKDVKSKEEAIEKLNDYAAELDVGYYPKLNQDATLEQFKKSLGEMEASIEGEASGFRGYFDNGVVWYHILKEIEGFRTLDKLWN